MCFVYLRQCLFPFLCDSSSEGKKLLKCAVTYFNALAALTFLFDRCNG